MLSSRNSRSMILKGLCPVIAAFIMSAVIASDAFALLYEDVSALELYERIEDDSDDGYIILDIRAPEEYAEGYIPEAINIPLKQLGYSLYILDKTKDIIVYCNIGLQSKVAAQVLANAGFKDVYNLTEGLEAWSYGLETNDGRVNI